MEVVTFGGNCNLKERLAVMNVLWLNYLGIFFRVKKSSCVS